MQRQLFALSFGLAALIAATQAAHPGVPSRAALGQVQMPETPGKGG